MAGGGEVVGAVRLVALDMDGTILESGRQIAPELIQALEALADRDIRCTTATGRPLRFQHELFPRFGLGTAGRLPHALMADERELFLLERAARTTVYRPHRTWNDAVRARWRTLHPVGMDWLRRTQREARCRGWKAEMPFSEEEMEARGLPTLALQGPAEAAELREWLQPQLEAAGGPAGPALAANRNVRLLQIHDAAVGKGLVLAELARLWQIEPGEVLAIGDSANDFSMLDGQLGFQCATVANADEMIRTAVRQSGGYVAQGRIGTGVAEILRRLLR